MNLDSAGMKVCRRERRSRVWNMAGRPNETAVGRRGGRPEARSSAGRLAGHRNGMVVCQRRRKVRERAWSRGDCYLGLRRQLGGTAASLVAGIQNRDVARPGYEHQTTVRKIGAVRR